LASPFGQEQLPAWFSLTTFAIRFALNSVRLIGTRSLDLTALGEYAVNNLVRKPMSAVLTKAI
jgi:hypothetical protein